MPDRAVPTFFSRPLRVSLLFLAGSAVFSAAYCIAPLYYSNQNQYFLHGLANAGVGLLHEDWLAKTHDPTPVFTALVSFTARYLDPRAFYLYYALILGAYGAAMLGLFVVLVGESIAVRRWPLFVAVFLAVHSALARWCSYRWFGQDYPWFFQAGVAGQYVLGAYLQPSAFGVLLIVAVCLFVRGREWSAGSCAALAAVFHPSYLLPAGLVTLGFLAALLSEGRRLQALRLGALTLGLVLPVLAHVVLVFGPTSAECFAQAEDILVNLRIPHHTRPDRWLDVVAVLQIAWLILALILARKPRLFLVLAVPFGVGTLLTFAQLATGSHTLALLFPWRVSAVLVPLASTVILSRLVSVRLPALDGKALRVVCATVVLIFVGAGVWISTMRSAFRSGDEEMAVMSFVKQTMQPGDVYFLPVTVPDLVNSTRGSLSSDFKPLPDKRRDPRIIPVDLQRFRLDTGAPIYVDFKAIPYKDAEVIEWRNRLRRAQTFQTLLALGENSLSQWVALILLRQQGITHLIVSVREVRVGWECELTFEDAHYRVYRVCNPGHAE